jgi:hypothetical protein
MILSLKDGAIDITQLSIEEDAYQPGMYKVSGYAEGTFFSSKYFTLAALIFTLLDTNHAPPWQQP